MGRMMGLEPTNTGTTTRGLNLLATPATKSIKLLSGLIVSKACFDLKSLFKKSGKFPGRNIRAGRLLCYYRAHDLS